MLKHFKILIRMFVILRGTCSILRCCRTPGLLVFTLQWTLFPVSAAQESIQPPGFSSHVLAGAILGTFFLTVLLCVGVTVAGLVVCRRHQSLAFGNKSLGVGRNINQGMYIGRRDALAWDIATSNQAPFQSHKIFLAVVESDFKFELPLYHAG